MMAQYCGRGGKHDRSATFPLLSPSRSRRTLVAAVCLAMLLVGAVSTSLFWKPERASQPQPRHEILLRLDTLAELATKRGLLQQLPRAADLGVERIVAFEENWAFLYLCGVSSQEMQSGSAAQQRPDGVSWLVRRILLIKPSTLLIDGPVPPDREGALAWSLLLKREGPGRNASGW